MTYLRLLWRWSWCITLPICALFIYWLLLTTQHYWTFGVRYISQPANITLAGTGKDQYNRILRRIQMRMTPRFTKGQDRGLETLNVFISERNIANLNSRLPHTGFQYVKGGLVVGDEIKKMNARYRGDTYVHWGPPKKSLRIKTKKKYLYKGMRRFNVMAPKDQFQIVNYSAYKLAEKLGLIVPRFDIVDVNLNGKPRGIHLLAEQFEELTLRNNGRMPGDLYAGELYAKDRYKGVSPYVFEHPGLWKKVSSNNHFDVESTKPLERLIALLNAVPTEENDRSLSRILDIEAWAKFAAFETLTQSFHFDREHNWRLYYDPWRQKFEPLIWDPLAWVSTSATTGPIVAAASRTKLHKALYRNPHFIVEKQKVINDFLSSEKSKLFLLEIDEVIEKIAVSVKDDPEIFDSEKAMTNLSIYRDRIENVFEEVRAEFTSTKGHIKYANDTSTKTQKIKLEISGRRPVTSLVLAYNESPVRPERVTIAYWVGERKIVRDVSGAVEIEGNRLGIRVPLVANYRSGKRDDLNIDVHNLGPAYYELSIDGVQSTLIALLGTRGSDGEKPAERATNIDKMPFVDALNIVTASPLLRAQVWRGKISFNGVNHITEEVIIEPGTNIVLGPDASLIFHNRVTAVGSETQIIKFTRETNEKPWGTIALQGKEASGSKFSYCLFSDGSGYKGDLFEYSGMFSVHDVDSLVINQCKFRNSHIVDDMMHVVYSDLEITNSEFSGALSDALDIDLSRARIENSVFTNNGNDSIDLMTSDLSLYNSYIANSGDKGISVGEGSRLLAIENRLENNAIGIQSKDGSIATLYNVDLAKNQHAIDAYKKNWRYASGGYLYVYNSKIVDNEKMVTADKHSKIEIYDTSIDQPIVEESKKKRIWIDGVDSSDYMEGKTVNKVFWRSPAEVDAMNGFDQGDWERADISMRGSKVLGN